MTWPAGGGRPRGPAGNRLPPGGSLGLRVGAATLPGAGTSRPPTTASQSWPSASRPRPGPGARPRAAAPGRTPRPARRASRGAATWVPRRERPTPGGAAPRQQTPRLAWPGPTPARCAPARPGAANLAQLPGPSRRRHAPGLSPRRGNTGRRDPQNIPHRPDWGDVPPAGPGAGPPDSAAGPDWHTLRPTALAPA